LKPKEIGNSLEKQSSKHEVIMNTKLYVGNLPFEVSETELQDLFAQHGTVTECHVVLDLATRKPRGFAFVTMESKENAEAAIAALHGKDWQGRPLNVNEARPRENRPAGDGGFGGNRGGGGYKRGERRPGRY
jgi:cold-inducible RNA-binding protein